MFLMHKRGSRARLGLERNLHASHFYLVSHNGDAPVDSLENPAADLWVVCRYVSCQLHGFWAGRP
jgi:hypothetical protein